MSHVSIYIIYNKIPDHSILTSILLVRGQAILSPQYFHISLKDERNTRQDKETALHIKASKQELIETGNTEWHGRMQLITISQFPDINEEDYVP